MNYPEENSNVLYWHGTFKCPPYHSRRRTNGQYRSGNLLPFGRIIKRSQRKRKNDSYRHPPIRPVKRYPGRVMRCENGTLTEDEQLTVRPHTLAPADIESIENTPLAEEAIPAEEGLVSEPIDTQAYPAVPTEEKANSDRPSFRRRRRKHHLIL